MKLIETDVMSIERDKEAIGAEFAERKHSIRSLLQEATRNYPPIKKDASFILNEVKQLFPELETLKNSIRNARNREG